MQQLHVAFAAEAATIAVAESEAGEPQLPVCSSEGAAAAASISVRKEQH